VFVTTKAQDTASVGPWLERLVEETTTVLVVQNGVNHEQRLRGLVPLEQVVPALAYIGAEQQQPGWVIYRGGNLLVLPSTPTAAGIAEAFTASPLLARLEPDFKTAAWKKLLGNLVANPLTALAMGRIGVLHRPDMRQLADGLLDEALAVANAEGADLDRSDADKVLDGLLSLPTTNGSSMLYDRLAGRPLEHEYLTGSLVQLAEIHGIDVPLNRAVLALLRAIEPGVDRGVWSS
jgi:2-dehydropantoate 2-reductase